MSKYLKNLEESAGLFEEAESKTVSLHSSKNNSLMQSKGNKYNKNDISIKYEEPQYQEVKNTYEVLKPITKQVVELPPTQKKKIKTTKTVYQKEIIVNTDEELKKVLQDEEYEEVPIPTKSTIQKLVNSLVVSNASKDNNSLSSSKKSDLYNSQKLKSKNNNYTINEQNDFINNNNDLMKTQIIYNTNKLSTKINNHNNNIISGKYMNKSMIQPHNPKLKTQIKKINNENIFDVQNSKISYKNKNYIETFFHDNDIPKPNVVEGTGLEFSDLKNPEEEKIIKKSMDSNNSNNHIKNMLDELPIEHTVLLSNQPKIDMSKIQKENMMQKSMTSEKSIISNTQSTSLHNKYKSQNLNLNNNNINNFNSKINNINQNHLINSMKNYPQKIINEKPIPEFDIINNSNNYNNNIINNSIKSNHTKIKPKMELPNNNTYINKININNSNINNQSKMSFPTSSHQGGSFISATSMVENPFKDNTSYNKENINN